jgi:hypothetical protein
MIQMKEMLEDILLQRITSEAGHAYHLGTPEFLVAYVLLNPLCSV